MWLHLAALSKSGTSSSSLDFPVEALVYIRSALVDVVATIAQRFRGPSGRTPFSDEGGFKGASPSEGRA